MALTYTPLATITVGSGGASTIEFTSIPQTYTDLVILLSSRTDQIGNNDDVSMRFNGSNTGYSNRTVYSTGSTVLAGAPYTDRVYVGSVNASSSTNNIFSSNQIYIPNYASSIAKTASSESVQENNAQQAFTLGIASLWNNTSAITSIILGYGSGNWIQHTKATLYGIKNTV